MMNNSYEQRKSEMKWHQIKEYDVQRMYSFLRTCNPFNYKARCGHFTLFKCHNVSVHHKSNSVSVSVSQINSISISHSALNDGSAVVSRYYLLNVAALSTNTSLDFPSLFCHLSHRQYR